jgi:hypothetical protein
MKRLIIGPENFILALWLKVNRLTKVFVAGSYSTADFAQEFSVFDKSFVLGRIADLKAEIVQIAEMLIVACVR